MGVPAHDERDFEFATERGLPVVRVVQAPEPVDNVWTGEGVLVDSGEFTGLSTERAREAIAHRLEAIGAGRRVVRYRMHDWLISRQRYWGPPIPIVYCEECGEVPVPEEDLPVLLPDVDDVRPTGTGRSPLASVDEFVRTTCPSCGGPASRETDVSDTFFDSAWYFLRYPSTDIPDAPWDPDRTARMLPVDQYAGGREHVVRHHLYARFVTHALHDLGLLPFAEPFPRIRLHGFITLAGSKMSKSRGNVVNPDAFVELLFCGPWEDGGEFSDDGLAGMERFVQRTWRALAAPEPNGRGGVDLRPLDRAVDAVGRGIERLKFNTAISALMDVVRWARTEGPAMSADEWRRVRSVVTLLFVPFAPHLAEEVWARSGGTFSVHQQPWPTFDPSALVEDEVTVVVQVDGKVRDRVVGPAGLGEEEALSLALASEKVSRYAGDGRLRRVVYVPDRLINLITKGRG